MNPKSVKKHICERLAHGEPIQKILSPIVAEGDVKPDLPDWNMVVQWLKDDEAFRADYDHAMTYGAKYLADEMLILKDQLLKDPKSATAYKTAMEMIKTSAMWRDPKYSERTIQEIRNNTPQDADVIAAKIKQLREELGMTAAGTIEMGSVTEVTGPVQKPPTAKQIAHYEKMRAARAAKQAARK